MALIDFTDKGLYCAAGDFYIDPWRPVDRAVITHAHSDHARAGSRHYLCHHLTLPILQLRLGQHVYQSVDWNEPVWINGVRISLHPSGHIIGAAQIRVEYKGEVWVVSGDYKTEPDGISGTFEPVPCHTFITESTFGLPVYRWQPQEVIFEQMRAWIGKNQQQDRASMLIAYSLGKAQRILQAIAPITNKIYVHGAIWNTHQVLLDNGIQLPLVQRITNETNKADLKSAVIIAPPGAEDSPWTKRLPSFRTATCSGWMQVRGQARRSSSDMGFALSDHADWNGLLSAVKATGASKVFVTHGFQSVFSRYLNEIGIEAAEVITQYGEEEKNTEEPA
ncbi:MAG: ligase-associated DNA damage response exonuclease [Chitinophagaceae bacterium]|nr:ligase-associated DNA damage response exonuclease [Chitinophagaceae bacterium]